MTLREVWAHINPGVPFDLWTPPYWFTWPNALTPEKVDIHLQLARELIRQVRDGDLAGDDEAWN